MYNLEDTKKVIIEEVEKSESKLDLLTLLQNSICFVRLNTEFSVSVKNIMEFENNKENEEPTY